MNAAALETAAGGDEVECKRQLLVNTQPPVNKEAYLDGDVSMDIPKRALRLT